jgi:Concanavalin A-like lectin/glucanases superfamily/Domain of unknown function (DUF2341)
MPKQPHFLAAAALLVTVAVTATIRAAPLSDPQVDSYNMRVGTQTFAGLYKFTTNTLLVETAQAITNLGSDTIKFYMGHNTSQQSGVTLTPNITNLLTLARDEPSYRRVLDMPFRHFIIWEYPFSNPDAPFQDGNYTSTEQANDYREMYDLAHYLLTNYNGTAKTFFLGHWEGDGYLSVNNWSTNPSPAVVTNMILWENTRQKAVDDAKAATTYSNVSVFYYAEANRVRDAMLNGPNNNVRLINAVVPYVTNLDYLSYSSYDAMNLNTSDLYTTLNYMQAHLPSHKSGAVPGERMWIGEYGWGGNSTASQEPLNRAYIQRLLGWNNAGQCLQFILFWEMYDNEVGRNYCLIDSNHVQTASWFLEQRFINKGRLLTAQFKETHGRLPTDTEFTSLMVALLNQPLPAPVNLTVGNGPATGMTTTSTTVAGTLTQGIYGSEQATLWLYFGPQDGGTVQAQWQQAVQLAVNTNFNPVTLSTTLSNLAPASIYYYRFYATNSSGEAWAPVSASFVTSLEPGAFSSRMKIAFNGYTRSEALTNFPALVNLDPNMPGFSYRQFASPSGGDLRFTDASGTVAVPHEIDEWDTNGVSSVWVRVPVLADSNDCVWAYWGNPTATNPPPYSTDGSVWSPNYSTVYHLKESAFPYLDSAQQHTAYSGVAPSSTTGTIGHGCAFSGSQFLDAGVINLGNAFTLSAWVNVAPDAFDIQAIWANQKGGFGSAGFAWFVNTYQTNNQEIDFASGDGSSGNESTTPSGTVSFGQWHLLSAAVNRAAGTVGFYMDGAWLQSGAVVPAFANQQDVNLGRFTNSRFYFHGSMDEARIASSAQSSNWLWADWLTVVSNTALSTYSSIMRQTPVLSIAGNALSGLVLAWPTPGVGFALYTATNLSPPAVWTPATNQPMLVNTQWLVAITPGSNPAQFYRLQPSE